MAPSMPRLLPAYLKAALAAVPLAGRLPGLPGGGGALPQKTWTLHGARLDAATLAKVRDLSADGARDLPLLAPHLLAFPLHMRAMTDGAFPYAAIGTVHIDNVVERYEPIAEDAGLDLAVTLRGPFSHRKGAIFTIDTTAMIDGRLVWTERSSMLRPGAKAPSGAAAPDDLDVPLGDAPGDGAQTEQWTLGDDLGRRWAAASGDGNPIHLHPLTAKPFGFPRAIIHGMWTAARITGALTAELPPAVRFAVRFEKPILLPGAVQLDRWRDADESTALLVRDPAGTRVHARARVSALPTG